jgi:hypothetical protein
MRICLAISILIGLATSVEAQDSPVSRPYVASDLGLAIFGEAAHREYIARAASLSTRAGLRWGDWGAYLQLEGAFWIAADGSEGDEWTGVVNFGVGGEYLYADDFVRTALAVGPSMLITGTDIDEPGGVGFFFELRPAGLRWALGEGWNIGLDPVVLSLTSPVLQGIPLIELEYRTTVVGEYTF